MCEEDGQGQEEHEAWCEAMGFEGINTRYCVAFRGQAAMSTLIQVQYTGSVYRRF